jgi:hypothetical protein
MPNVDAHWQALVDPRVPSISVPLHCGPLFCRFQEHHCLHPDTPLSAGTAASGLGDDVLNAWLPRSFNVMKLEVSQQNPRLL